MHKHLSIGADDFQTETSKHTKKTHHTNRDHIPASDIDKKSLPCTGDCLDVFAPPFALARAHRQRRSIASTMPRDSSRLVSALLCTRARSCRQRKRAHQSRRTESGRSAQARKRDLLGSLLLHNLALTSKPHQAQARKSWCLPSTERLQCNCDSETKQVHT